MVFFLRAHSQAFAGTRFMAQRPTTAIDATASSEGASEKSAAGKDGGRALADGGDEGGSRDMRERERRRLETLREYRILDTAPEPASK